MSTSQKKLLDEVWHKRHQHIEMYAAAFLREVGTDEASQYILVEHYSDNKIRWSFEKKHD